MDVQLTSPQSETQTRVGETDKCFHSMVELVRTVPAILKHANLWILLSVLLELAV